MPLQLSLFGSRKQRGKAPPTPSEGQIQEALVQLLDRWGTRGWRYTHIASGGLRDKITASILKRRGVKRGWPDLIFLSPYPPSVNFLELKRRGEALSDAQQDFQLFCADNGYRHAVADNLQDAVAILKDWGALRASVSA